MNFVNLFFCFKVLLFGWKVYCQVAADDKEWKLVFKVTTGAPFGVYDLYKATTTMNEDNSAAMQLDNQLQEHYKADFLNTWGNNNVTRVKVSVFKDSMEKAYLIFDGTGSNNENWFTGSKLLNTSFEDIDIMKSNTMHFSVRGDDVLGVLRRFFINRQYSGCGGDNGWLIVTDAYRPNICNIDKVTVTTVFYSTKTTYDLYNNFEEADCLAVFVERPILKTDKECGCRCYTDVTYLTLNDTEALQQKLDEIRQTLKIVRNTTSKYIRTKISAPDDRPSAKGIGAVLGAGILTFTVLVVIISDLPVLCRQFYICTTEKMLKKFH